MIEKKIAVVQCRKNRANLLTDLLRDIHRTVRVPKKRDMPTEAEEKQRAHLTWQDFDFMLHLCTVCPETLKKYVVDVEEFRQGKVAIDKDVNEAASAAKRTRRRQKRWKAIHDQQASAPIEDEPPHLSDDSDEEGDEKEAKQGNVVQQVRGTEAKGAHKKRVTLLHRATLHGVCQRGSPSRPQGKQEKLVLIIPGKHGCSTFISQNENGVDVWNRDWEYEYCGKLQSITKASRVGISRQVIEPL